MLITYFGNAFGSPPPSAALVARLGLTIWLIPLWAWWFDRHRDVRMTAP